MHPGRPYQAAQNQMNQYYNQAQAGMQPYNQYGQAAGQQVQDATGKLLDPAALQAEWMKSYNQSPQAQQAIAQATDQGMGEAGAMGLLGSSAAIQGLQSQAGQIASADRQKYLDDLMAKYTAGTGLAQNTYGTGANMAGQMGQNAMNMGNISGGLAGGQAGAGAGYIGQGLGFAANALANRFGWGQPPNQQGGK
jgi:hypothetical protein